MSRTCVPERVRGNVLLYARQLHTAFDHRPDAVGIHLASPAIQNQPARIITVNERVPHHQDIVLNQLTDPLA